VQDVAATKTDISKTNASGFTRWMQTKAQYAVNALIDSVIQAHRCAAGRDMF
jgi:hypothetical protein